MNNQFLLGTFSEVLVKIIYYFIVLLNTLYSLPCVLLLYEAIVKAVYDACLI